MLLSFWLLLDVHVCVWCFVWSISWFPKLISALFDQLWCSWAEYFMLGQFEPWRRCFWQLCIVGCCLWGYCWMGVNACCISAILLKAPSILGEWFLKRNCCYWFVELWHWIILSMLLWSICREITSILSLPVAEWPLIQRLEQMNTWLTISWPKSSVFPMTP